MPDMFEWMPQKVLDRMLLIEKGVEVPDEPEEPWLVFTRIVKDPVPPAGRCQIAAVVPKYRVEDWWGEEVPWKEALRRAEGIFCRHTTRISHLIGMRALIRSPAPATWDYGHKSPRRASCTTHCAGCNLHFTSQAAFDQHCRERHRHPSRSEKIVKVEDRDTGCALMGTTHLHPTFRYLPKLSDQAAFVPGVRLWEHVDAERVRQAFADRR